MENGNPIRTLVYYSRPSHEGYQNTIELPDENNVMPLQSDTIVGAIRIAHSTDIRIWALLEDLALYDNESWNDPRDFAKLVKAISFPQDVLNTSDRRLIELENQFLPNGRPPKFIPLQTVFEIGTPKPKGPEHALENECKDLHLNLTVLEVLGHAPIYNHFLINM
ncbi:hypothetical protein Tco_0765295 [Tanacetum coccineum]